MPRPSNRIAPIEYTPISQAIAHRRAEELKYSRIRACLLIGCLLLVGAIVAAAYFLLKEEYKSTSVDTNTIGLTQNDPNNQPLSQITQSSSTGASAQNPNEFSSSSLSSTANAVLSSSSFSESSTEEASSSSTGSDSESSTASESSSSSTGENESSSSSTGSQDIAIDPSVLEFAARFTSNVDPDTQMLLPERNQFPDTPCAIPENASQSPCQMDIVVVFGETATDYTKQATSFSSQFKTYHWNANNEIVPYDFTSNLFGEYPGIQTVSPLLDQYYAFEGNEFRNLLVINALNANTSQTEQEAWYPTSVRFQKVINATRNALTATQPGSSVIFSMVHLPDRPVANDTIFKATNLITAIRQDVLAQNNSAIVLTHLNPLIDAQVNAHEYFTASSSAQDLALALQAAQNNIETDPLPEFKLYLPLQNDLSFEGTFTNTQVTYINDQNEQSEPVFKPDDPAFGRYTALSIRNVSPDYAKIECDQTFSFELSQEQIDSNYYSVSGTSAWQVITPSYTVGFWAKQSNATEFEPGFILRTSYSAENIAANDFFASVEQLQIRFNSLREINTRHSQGTPIPESEPAEIQGITYTSNDNDLLQPDAWTHFVVTYDARPDQLFMRLFVNGTQVVEINQNSWNGSAQSMYIGGYPGFPNLAATIELIRNLRIWHIPLSADQIKQVFVQDQYKTAAALI